MTEQIGASLQHAILTATGASKITSSKLIQELWSGYGEILRIRLDNGSSVVAKSVRIPDSAIHPRGWNTNHSHQRKVRSYQVETTWYREWSQRCDETCRVPRFLDFEEVGNGILLLLLEDLDQAGYPARLSAVTLQQSKHCLTWLANFHATFMNEAPTGLWKTGTYWHLDTRSDELAALDDLPLKQAASAIDRKLNQASFQTLVHGDAKLANFCFSEDGEHVSAVDFQYVGGGCGMKDVAYFLGSCLDETQCEQQEAALLDHYFCTLRESLAKRQSPIDPSAIESEWRELFPLAWTDFHRFLKGWSPGHWKLNGYSERVAREVVAELRSK